MKRNVINYLSDLAKANVEALANDEDFNLDDFNDNCYWYQVKIAII